MERDEWGEKTKKSGKLANRKRLHSSHSSPLDVKPLRSGITVRVHGSKNERIRIVHPFDPLRSIFIRRISEEVLPERSPKQSDGEGSPGSVGLACTELVVDPSGHAKLSEDGKM